MLKLEIGTLIYDLDDKEWGLISGRSVATEQSFMTIWSKSKDQILFYSDFEQDRFVIYNV